MHSLPSTGAAKLKDEGSSRRHVRKVLGWFLPVLFWGTMVRAGEDPLSPIEMGRILFYPSLDFSYALEDNVVRRNEDDPFLPVVASSVRDIRPKLLFEAPFQRSFTSLAYSPKFRDYGAEELEGASGTSHYFDFAHQHQVTPSLRIALQDNFLRGITELMELAPGDELRFGIQPFRSNSALAGLSLEMGPIQSVELAGGLNTTRFDAVDESGLVSSMRLENLMARYLVATGPDNRWFLAADWQNSIQKRTVETIEPTDYRTRSLGLGMRRGVEQRLTSELKVSYAVVDFPGEEKEPYEGITAECELGMQVGTSARLALKLNRGPRTSFFNTNSFYLNEVMEFTYSQEMGQRLGMELGVRGQDNSYPEPVRVEAYSPEEDDFDLDGDGYLDVYEYLLPSEGVRRRDHVRGGMVRFICHLARAMDVQVEYRRDRVRSNIVAARDANEYKYYDYDYESLTTSLTVGWK